MFVSKLSKWEWLKIYSKVHFRYSLQFISPKKKKIDFIALIILTVIILTSNTQSRMTIIYSILLLFFILNILPIVLFFPKYIILFLSEPSLKKQDKIKSLFIFIPKYKYKTSLNFEYNILLNKRYKALIETKDYFVLYPKDRNKYLLKYLIIKKSDNQKQLTKNGSSISKLVRPLCDEYKKL